MVNSSRRTDFFSPGDPFFSFEHRMPRDQRPPFRKPSGFKKPRRKQPRRDESAGDGVEGVRLQKIMASAGLGSRRHCEDLIAAGRVQINGEVAKLGARVPEGAKVTVDGESLRIQSRMVHYLVNKPNGVVCTNYDQSGRTRVIDLVPQDEREHLFTVGRLDLSSEGLIIVTNDGELANHLTHPKFGVEKTYLALIAGRPEPGVLQKLRQGVHLAEGVARCVSVYVKKELPQSTLLEIVLNEGKNREIRRILAKVGHKVLTLKRTAIGDVTMRGLRPGEFRPLSPRELRDLREAHARRRKPSQSRPVDEAELLAAAKPAGDDAGAPTENQTAPRREGAERHERPRQPAYGRRPSGRGGYEERTVTPRPPQDGPRYGKPPAKRTVLGGGDGRDDGDAQRRGKRRFERRGGRPEGATGGRPPLDKRPPARGGDEGESLGSHPQPQPPRSVRPEGTTGRVPKKFARKRRPTPLFPKRKKRG